MKQMLKQLRAWPPLNHVATTIAKRAAATGLVDTERLIRHLPRTGQIGIVLPNGAVMHLWSNGDDWIANQMFWRGWDGYEQDVVRVFFALAKRSHVTLDVGAYVGTYALLAALANPRAEVIAIEPFPETFERLKINVGLNDVPRLHTICAAVGATDGEGELFYVDSAGLKVSCSTSSDFMTDQGQTPSVSLKRVRVPILTLDRLIENRALSTVDVVKIDTESTEPQVLQGMRAVLERYKPHLFMEVLGHTGTGREIQALVRDYSYRFYHLLPEGPTLRETIEPAPPWDNYLITTMNEAEVREACSS